jgi:hypothetical protein
LAVDAGASPVSGLSVSKAPETVRQRPEKPNQIKGWDFPVRQRKPLISLIPHRPARLTTLSLGNPDVQDRGAFSCQVRAVA